MKITGTQSWHERLWRLFSNVTGQNAGTLNVGITAAGNLDAFGRTKVANPATLFDSQMQYDTQPLLWAEKLVGTATVTHIPAESAADLTIGTASGDRVVRQTREYFRYQPGKAQSALCTGVLGAAQAGTTKLIGYGDDNNGVFLGVDGGGVFMLLRSASSGSVSDARKVYQTDWNTDTLDGDGPSGVVLDTARTQIFALDMEWLGVGSVRTGFVIDGRFVYAHIFHNANVVSSTYMTTANLPLRYEVRNDAATAAASTLKQICAQVTSDGGQDRTAAYPFSVVLTDVAIPNGEENAIIVFAARHRLLFNGIENRATFIPLGYEVLPEGGRAVCEILYNPALVGGTWADVNAASIVEGNSTVTSFTGGTALNATIAAGGAAKSGTPIVSTSASDRLPFGLDIDGANAVPLALKAYALENGVSASFTFQWEEVR